MPDYLGLVYKHTVHHPRYITIYSNISKFNAKYKNQRNFGMNLTFLKIRAYELHCGI